MKSNYAFCGGRVGGRHLLWVGCGQWITRLLGLLFVLEDLLMPKRLLAVDDLFWTAVQPIVRSTSPTQPHQSEPVVLLPVV